MTLTPIICAFEAGVKVVKEVIAHKGELVVRVKCLVDSYHNFIITTFGNVPADLRSAGIKYKDLRSAKNTAAL